MSQHSQVTTQYIADQPVVFLIKQSHSELSAELEKQLAAKSVQVTPVLVEEIGNKSDLIQKMRSAYKIIFHLGLEWWVGLNDQEKQSWLQLLQNIQSRLVIVFAINSDFKEAFTGEIPFWHETALQQRQTIEAMSGNLPNAVFVFGLDVVDNRALATTIIIFQKIQTGLIFAPQMKLYLQSNQDFVKRVVHYALEPQRRSVLVKGKSNSAIEVAQKTKHLYQSYHFSPLNIQVVDGNESNPMIFSVVENFVAPRHNLVEYLASHLPSPSMERWPQLENYVSVQTKSEEKNESFLEVDESLGSQNEKTIKSLNTPLDSSADNTSETQIVKTQNEQQLPPGDEPKDTASRSTTYSLDDPPEQPKAKSRINSGSDQQFDVNSELHRIFTSSHLGEKKSKKTQTEKKKIRLVKKSKRRTGVFYGGLAITGLGLGILFVASMFFISTSLLKKNLSSTLSDQGLNPTSVGSQEDENDLRSLARLSNLVEFQVNGYHRIFNLPQIETASSLAKTGKLVVHSQEQAAEADQLSKKLVSQLLGKDDGDIGLTAEKLAAQSLLVYENLSQLNNEVSQLDLYDAADGEAPSSFKDIKDIKNNLAAIQQLQPILADLAGANQPRTYALVFQNNQELRPTGGYIEAVAVFSFNDGSLSRHDIYGGLNLDNMLQGSVIPPEEIQQYLGEESWSIRDSNWDPHYPKAAEQMSWFLEKSLGRDIDGVITVDIDGLSQLLKATGPVDVPEYNEVLTDKNLAEYIEFHTDTALKDSEKDYRQLIFEKIWQQLIDLSPEKTPILLTALQSNFTNQHMLASFRRADELRAMTNLGWSGSLLQPGCPGQFTASECLVDSFAQVEANVGINRANYYLQRSIEHSIKLGDDSARHTRQVTFENTAQSESWPKGPYKAYVRFYLPENAAFEGIRISNQPVAEEQLRKYKEHNRLVIGAFIEVPVKSSKTISLLFSTPLPSSRELAYTFFEQTQPGSGETDYQFTMTPTARQTVQMVAPQAEILDDKVVFSHRSPGSGFFGIQLAQEK